MDNLESEKKYIGFFDSGVGGLTVLYRAMSQLPQERFVYYADVDNVPYGDKDKAEIEGYIAKAVEDMAALPLKAIVIACNTATSAAIRRLRDRYSFPIIGMEPAIKPAVEAAQAGEKILVLATAFTLQNEKYQALKNKLCIHPDRLIEVPMPELVDAAENFIFKKDQIRDIVAPKLNTYPLQEVGHVVLGCTHFVYYKNTIQSIFDHPIQCHDGNQGAVNQLISKIELYQDSVPPMNNEPPLRAFLSGHEIDPELLQPYLTILQRIP